MFVRIPLGMSCLVMALVVSGCATDAGTRGESTSTTGFVTTPTGSILGGDRLPAQVPGESIVHASVPVTGILTLEPNGCWTVDLGDRTRVVAFPVGTEKPEGDGTLLVVPGGVEVSSGLRFDGRGGVVSASSLPGGADGFWGNHTAFCEPGALEIAVLDVVSPALDVAALTDERVADLLRDARLTAMWGCGNGFAVSNEDQTVAVRMYAGDTGDPTPGDVTFPDPGWTAKVSVGSLLMANHCDDVSEGWEADPKEALSLPLVAGTLSIAQLPDAPCGSGGALAALSGATVRIGGADIVLGEIALENDAFGCFAG